MDPGIRIRPIVTGDLEALEAFYAGLSAEARRTRFFALVAGIGRPLALAACRPDGVSGAGFVAVTGPDAAGPERIVGHLGLEPDGPASVEVGIAVAEELRRRGVARRLMRAGVAWARRRAIPTMRATMLVGNPAIERLLTGLGLPWTSRLVGSGLAEVRIAVGDAGRTVTAA